MPTMGKVHVLTLCLCSNVLWSSIKIHAAFRTPQGGFDFMDFSNTAYFGGSAFFNVTWQPLCDLNLTVLCKDQLMYVYTYEC